MSRFGIEWGKTRDWIEAEKVIEWDEQGNRKKREAQIIKEKPLWNVVRNNGWRRRRGKGWYVRGVPGRWCWGDWG